MATITANKDTYVYEYYPTTDYGNYAYTRCRDYPTHKTRALIGFDISSLDVSTLTAATLYLYCTHEENETITVKRITSGWTESTNWNNKPTYTDTNCTSFSCRSTGWRSVNVLSMLQDQSGSDFSVRLTQASSNNTFTQFKSSEQAAYEPYLSITGGTPPGDKYVDIATGSDSDSGNTWASAYLTVKKGIDNLPANDNLHIAEGDYSAQAAIDLNQNINLICEDYGGGNANPPLTVVLPATV